MKVSVTAIFETTRPVSQYTGAEFWKHGSRFVSAPGGCKYTFTTDGESDSVTDAIEVTENIVLSLVMADGHNTAEIVKMEAERV